MNPPGDSAKPSSSKEGQDRLKAETSTTLLKAGTKKKRIGNLIVVTGPSGVGKGTVVTRLLTLVPLLTKSVSVTTRPMRQAEVEGTDYFFCTEDEFLEMHRRDKFLEWAEYAGNYYGTPRAWVKEQLQKGKDVVLEIEVQGAIHVLEQAPEAVLIFLSPPSIDELKSRLKGRATDSPASQALRLTKARQEIRAKGFFHYEVVNDDIEEAVNNLLHIVYAERCRIKDRETNEPPNEHYKNS